LSSQSWEGGLDRGALYTGLDGGWGHTDIWSVNHDLPATAFDGKFYEWDYGRVHPRP
jgi:hypothetical protein